MEALSETVYCTHNIFGSLNERWQIVPAFKVSTWKRHITSPHGSLAKASHMAIPDLNQGEKCRPPVFPVDEKNWNICEQMRLSLTDALAAYGLWTEEEGKCGSQRWVGVALVAREEEHQRGSSIKLARLDQGLDRRHPERRGIRDGPGVIG